MTTVIERGRRRDPDPRRRHRAQLPGAPDPRERGRARGDGRGRAFTRGPGPTAHRSGSGALVHHAYDVYTRGTPLGFDEQELGAELLADAHPAR